MSLLTPPVTRSEQLRSRWLRLRSGTDGESRDSQMPDPRTMSTLIFECGSPEWIAEVGTLLESREV